jgi:putative membrane protein
MWHIGDMSGAWWTMNALWLAFLVVIVLLAWRVATQGAGGRGAQGNADPKAILDARLARGEIDIEEYTARRAALRGEPPRDPSA